MRSDLDTPPRALELHGVTRSCTRRSRLPVRRCCPAAVQRSWESAAGTRSPRSTPTPRRNQHRALTTLSRDRDQCTFGDHLGDHRIQIVARLDTEHCAHAGEMKARHRHVNAPPVPHARDPHVPYGRLAGEADHGACFDAGGNGASCGLIGDDGGQSQPERAPGAEASRHPRSPQLRTKFVAHFQRNRRFVKSDPRTLHIRAK